MDDPEEEPSSSHDDTMDTSVDDTQESVDDASYPFVVMSVEEISVVKCLTNWLNTKIRVIGIFEQKMDGYVFMGVLREHGEVYLNLDSVAIENYPLLGEIVEAFARLYKDHTTPEPVIKVQVLFFRKLRGDIASYKSALNLLKPYIPPFIKRKAEEKKD